MQITVVDFSTGEVSLRDMTAEERAAMPKPEDAPKLLSREAFCVALVDAQIFTKYEATEAALGVWPPKFEPALAGKSLVEKLTIKNLWRDTKSVTRDAALFLDLLAFYAQKMGLDAKAAESLGDRIFGLEAARA